MKSIKTFGMVLLCLLLAVPTMAKKRISFAQALKSKMIQAKFEGSGKGHYGESISMVVRNASAQQLEVYIEAGRMLASRAPEKQNMVITQPLILVISPGQTRKGLLNAMCGEMHDGSPRKGTPYSYAAMAKSSVKGVASLIGEHDYQNVTAQNAVWALTDKNPIENIEGDDPVMVEILKSYVKKALGLEREKKEEFIPAFRRPSQNKEVKEEKKEEVPAFLRHSSTPNNEQANTNGTSDLRQPANGTSRERNYQPSPGSARIYTLKGRLPVQVPKAGKVQLVLCDPSGQILKTIRESEAPRAGKITFTYEVKQQAQLRGKYTVKALQDGEELKRMVYDLD